MGGDDDDNDGNGNKKQAKQYKAELIPGLHYKPNLAKELRDKQMKKKEKKKGHNMNSITGEHDQEENKEELKEIDTTKPPDKGGRRNSVPDKSTANNTKNTKMGINTRIPPASQSKQNLPTGQITPSKDPLNKMFGSQEQSQGK